MRGHFETDKRYPWTLQVRGDKWRGFNAHTDEWLPGDKDYTTAREQMDEHIAKVKASRELPQDTVRRINAANKGEVNG